MLTDYCTKDNHLLLGYIISCVKLEINRNFGEYYSPISYTEEIIMGIIMDAIDSQIIRPRVTSAESEGFAQTQADIQNFYSSGSPVRYRRTRTYGNSPNSSGASGGNGNYHYEIHLEPQSYSTGTHSPEQILSDIQVGGSGILGTPGTWDNAEQDIIEAVIANFS